MNSPSVIRSWFEPKIRKSVENCKFFEENPATALILRKYLPSQFRPSAAKCLMDIINPKSFYDPCAGWGDRLSAAMAKEIPNIYLRDVNPLVFCGYVQQVNDLCPKTSEVGMELVGCEDPLNINNLDMIFTSPPYFSIEKYQGELQSFRKYKKFEQWLNQFLFKMIQNNLDALSSNGVFLLNVSDVYANHTYNKIVGPIIETFKSEVKGVFGYRMRKRLNSKSNQEGIFGEPVIMFRRDIFSEN